MCIFTYTTATGRLSKGRRSRHFNISLILKCIQDVFGWNYLKPILVLDFVIWLWTQIWVALLSQVWYGILLIFELMEIPCLFSICILVLVLSSWIIGGKSDVFNLLLAWQGLLYTRICWKKSKSFLKKMSEHFNMKLELYLYPAPLQ